MNWEKYNNLIAAMKAGRTREATNELVSLSEAEQDPSYRALLLTEAANGHRNMREIVRARQDLESACSLLGPGNELCARPLYLAAAIDVDERDWEDAIRKTSRLLDQYKRFLEKEDNRDLWENVNRVRGIALTELKRFQEAIVSLEAARTVELEHDVVLSYLGVCYFHLGNMEKSRLAFLDLLETRTQRFVTISNLYLGVIDTKFGRWAYAKLRFEEALAFCEFGHVPYATIVKWLLSASQALNLEDEARKYSGLLKGCDETGVRET